VCSVLHVCLGKEMGSSDASIGSRWRVHSHVRARRESPAAFARRGALPAANRRVVSKRVVLISFVDRLGSSE
jgi:hypothetical protein